jgi:hypothetical protein
MRSFFLHLWTQDFLSICLVSYFPSLHQDNAILLIYMVVCYSILLFSVFSGLELLSLLEDKIASRASLT